MIYTIGKYYLLKIVDPDFEKKSIYTCEVVAINKNSIDIYTIKKENLTIDLEYIKFTKEIEKLKFDELIYKNRI